MPEHNEAQSRTVSAIRMIASEAISLAKEIENLCDTLESEGIHSIPVKFFDTANRGNKHLRSFGRAIRDAIQEYHATGEGVTRKPRESDAAMIARVSAELAAQKPKAKRNTKKKSG